MPKLVPVDGDPFAAPQSAPQPKLAPVDHDPFAPPKPAYTGSILPFSVDAQGNASFDSNAGIVGAIKRVVTAPGRVARGELDPMSDEAIGTAFETAAGFSPVSPAARAGAGWLGVQKTGERAKVEAPSAEALKGAASRAYDEARDLGVDYSSTAVRDMAQTAQAGLEKDGILAELAPKAFGILGKLQSPPEGSVASLTGLEAARRALGHAARDFSNPTEQAAAQQIMEQLDGFIRQADPSTVVAGPAPAAAKLYDEARGNYAAAKRSDKLTGIEDTAELRAAAANSGLNLDNTIRQRIASLLTKPKDAAGFSEAERAGLEEVVRGTRGRNTARFVGNLAGGGGGLGAVVTGGVAGAAGSAIGGPAGAVAGAAIPAVGVGSKLVANALAKKALSGVDEMVRTRSPLYEQLAREAPVMTADPERRAAIIRALLLQQAAEAENN